MNKNKVVKNSVLVLSSAFVSTIGFSSFIVYKTRTSKSYTPELSDEVAVAYIKGASGNTYFSSISKALEVAKENNESQDVYVIVPSSVSNIMLESTANVITIGSGDRLILPYEGENYYSQLANQNNPNEVYTITLAANTTLIIENGASLIIGGQIGVYNTRHQYFTNGNYASFVLEDKSKIDLKGSISSYGFIREANDLSDDKGYIEAYSGSKITTPLSIEDFPGGTSVIGQIFNKSALFFREYDISNLKALTKFCYGSTLEAEISIYMSGKFQDTLTANIIGNNLNTGLLLLDDSDSYLIWDYSSKSVNEKDKRCIYISTYGNMTFDHLTLKLIMDVSTADYYFPFTDLFDFTINGALTLKNKVKFLPGSRVTINPTGVINANADVIFYNLSDNQELVGYTSKEKNAELILNGTLNLNQGFNGKITLGNQISSNAYITTTTNLNDLDENNEYYGYPPSGTNKLTGPYYFDAITLWSQTGSFSDASYQVIPAKGVKYFLKKENDNSFFISGLRKITFDIFYTENEGIGAFYDPNFVIKVTTSDGTINTYTNPEYLEISIGDKFAILSADNVNHIIVRGQKYESNNMDSLFKSEFTVTDSDEIIEIDMKRIDSADRIESVEIFTKDNVVDLENGDEVTFEGVLNPSVNTYYYEDEVEWVCEGGSPKISTDPNNPLKATMTFSTKSDRQTINIKLKIKDKYTNQFVESNTITVTVQERGCFATGTKILLANGCVKNIERILPGDKVLTWNFFKHNFEEQIVMFIVDHGFSKYDVLNMIFEGGHEINIIGDHGLFDIDLNKFVYINKNNCYLYLNHNFAIALKEKYVHVKLINYNIVSKETNSYSLTSSYNYNVFANGLLTAPPPNLLYNWIEMGGEMQYDLAKFNADIKKYGTYDYSIFRPYGITYETFILFNGPYLKVPVEKEIFTFDYIIKQFNLYKEWINS